MKTADKAFMKKIDALCEARKAQILQAPDQRKIKGTAYYVSCDGDDTNDGLTQERAWRTLEKVSAAELSAGDGVFFKRGDLFRGYFKTKPGVTYAAYGKGEKPKFYGWDKSLADPELWELFDAECCIWKLTEPIPDCGTLVFNDGEAHCRKLIPTYRNGKFVCRDDESRDFVVADEMTCDLDMVCLYDSRTTDIPSKGECFPIPVIDAKSLGELYLRCDQGNPGKVYKVIEALPHRHMIYVGANDHVTIDNLCLKYIGCHAISAGGHCVGLHVSNCEIGWIGGSIQHYFGTDPNYPVGKRGTVTRFGNGVEIYGGCDDYQVLNCYIYQCYDAGITHQVTTCGEKTEMRNVLYKDNLVEKCVYSIEYFLEMDPENDESCMDRIEMCGNILRESGYGWGQQRHNTDTPAHIKGWSYENRARHYTVHDNIFDRAAYRMLHLVAKETESCPEMYNNTYIQHHGNMIGQYGGNAEKEPSILLFDDKAEEKILSVFGDKDAKVYVVENMM